jgi:acyl dehydratase
VALFIHEFPEAFRLKVMSQIRNQTILGLTVGETFRVSRQFTEKEVTTFADLTRDYNPIHFDERFIQVKKLKGKICHGLLVGSLLTEIGGQIGWLASEMNFRFKKPVYFGDTIDCSLTITEIDARNRARAKVIYRNQDGVIVLEAELAGILPGNRERKILGAILSEEKLNREKNDKKGDPVIIAP